MAWWKYLVICQWQKRLLAQTLSAQTSVDTRHNEEQPGVQNAFLRDIKALKASFDEYRNPFLGSSNDLLVLDTRDIADKAIVDTLYKIEELGLKLYNNFVKERLIERVK